MRDFRVSAWLDDANAPLAGEVRERLELALEKLEKAGARVDRSARPALDPSHARETYQHLTSSILGAGLPPDGFPGVEVLQKLRASEGG